MQDTPGHPLDYEPLRRTLLALRREMERCAAKYPALYHERIAARAPDYLVTLDDVAWNLFRESVSVQAGEDVPEVIWDGPHSEGFFGRFIGDPEGLEEFCRLCESIVLALAEFSSIPDDGGYSAWLEVIHDMAFRQATPLLRSDLTLWGFEEMPSPEDSDRLALVWSGPIGEPGQFPHHPCIWKLTHSVFVSSVAALDAILDETSILLVGGKPLDTTPAFEWSGQRRSTQTQTTTASHVDEHLSAVDQLESRFSLEGAKNRWLIEFRSGTIYEKDVATVLGCSYYAILLERPDEWIHASDLTRLVHLPPGELRSAIRQQHDVYDDSDTAGDAKKRQEMVDEAGIKEVDAAIEHLKRQIEASDSAGLDIEVAQLRQQLHQLEQYRKASVNVSGRSRPFTADDERSRKNIQNRLKGFRDSVRESMPNLADHLDQRTESQGGHFVYLATPDVKWRIQR